MRRVRRVLRWLVPACALLLAAAAAPAWAHVGSPNVFYDGDAGPYPVRVVIRPPIVIPGLAEITVRLRDGGKADRVTLQPLQYKAGLRGAPAPDPARPVPGAPDVWSGELWLMSSGSFSIRVHVQGAGGEGTVLVPVPAVRRQVLGMAKGLGALLAALGLFLIVGAISIIAVAVREASLAPGEEIDGRRRKRARVAAVCTALLFALVVFGGNGWWNAVDRQVRKKLFKPFGLNAGTLLQAGRPVLTLAIDDRSGKEWVPLVPDHGKLMHMFVIREPGLDAFAHLHPVARDKGQKSYRAALPPLPAGTYRVYSDVVDENGFAQTLVGRVAIPAVGPAAAPGEAPGGMALDPDDSWSTSEPLRPAATTATAVGPKVSRLADGGTILWHQEPLEANRETTLRFEVRGPDGQPAPLEPYMGMLSHAAITRDDGQVFIHLHPMGTVSMAAQEVFVASAEKAAAPGMDHSAMPGMPGMQGSVLSFPYEFPQPGRYRVWVQVKSGGRILTGVFDADVAQGRSGPV